MRRLFRFFFQLFAMALAFVMVTVIWIIFDGLNDVGEKADVALVTSRDDFHAEGGRDWLERVAHRYKDGDFGAIIVTTAGTDNAPDETDNMRKYLVDHGVPSKAVLEATGARDTWGLAVDVSEIMKGHDFQSVMLVTNYYRMTRLKLALKHAGVLEVEKSHLGSVRLDDSWSMAREVCALYYYVGKTFLLPAAEKLKDEAKVEADKAGVEAEKARANVDKDLDKLPK